MNRKTTTKYARVLALIVTISSIYFFAPWEYALYYLKPLPDSVQQELDGFTKQGADSVIVYVDKAGSDPEYYSSGLDNRITQVPVRPDALFKIASIAKLYDAAAITKLVGENRLSLNGTLSDYLPFTEGRIENANQITIRMMVQHRSGIPNFTDHERYHWGELDFDIMELVLDQPADFAPDQDYAYSNTNYLLLQQIIAEITGAPHGEYIRQALLDPLGLKRTYFSVNEINKDELISGYHLGYDDDLRHLDQGYVSTAKEVAIFLRALNDGSLFTEKEQQVYSSLYEYNHTGWVLGYQSIAKYHPEDDMIVIQFISTTGNDLVLLTHILYNRIVEILRST